MAAPTKSSIQKTVAPYGSWRSPISSKSIASSTIGFGTIVLDEADAYWIETRPAEGGRHVIVCRNSKGKRSDVIPREFNARTRVHEYGGGAFTAHKGVVYFSNFADQRLYRQTAGEISEAVTKSEHQRFAEPQMDVHRNRLIAVCEDHSVAGREPANRIVSIALDGSGKVEPLAQGNDFYAFPCLSADGSKLAWITWNHPNMPWDGCELWIARVTADGAIIDSRKVAGGGEDSIFQPQWSPDGRLYFISDREGWWNLYRLDGSMKNIEPVCLMEAEFGRPLWHLGYSLYAFAGAQRIICTYNQKGIWHLGQIDLIHNTFETIESPYTDIWWLKISGGHAVFRGGSPTEAQAIVRMNLRNFNFKTLARSTKSKLDPEIISVPTPIEYAISDNQRVHAFYYKPKNPKYAAPAGEKPPLLVRCHGGPTGSTSTLFNPEYQYWTSRGFAILDVNYRGSSGFGRRYLQSLRRKWGLFDVEDVVRGATYLADIAEVDAGRLLITGGSAGGFTVLCALTFRRIFRAGASYYGVGDLEAIAKDTHKYESRYLDGLIAPYPDGRDAFIERSPLFSAEKLMSPVIFFQGLEDKIVPPNQSEAMVDALRKKGIPVAYIAFPGEQHGFRGGDTIKRCLDAELYFYSRILGFELPDAIDPVQIENL